MNRDGRLDEVVRVERIAATTAANNFVGRYVKASRRNNPAFPVSLIFYDVMTLIKN